MAEKVKIFDGALTTSYQASAALLMEGGAQSSTMALDFYFTVTGADTEVLWYLEFADAPNDADSEWVREVAEEDTGGGVTRMPIVVRRFNANNSTPTGLAAGSYGLTTQFVRRHKYFRIQIAIAGGGGAVPACKVYSQFGLSAILPRTS